jgi:hypothetical protein
MKGKDDRFQEGLMRKGGVNLRPSSPRPESPSGQQVSNNKIATIEGTLLKMGYKHTIKNTNDILRLPYIKNTEWSFEFEGCPHISSKIFSRRSRANSFTSSVYPISSATHPLPS